MGDHPLLLEWHGSATASRSIWELVEGFLVGINVGLHNSKCIGSTVSGVSCRMLKFMHADSCQSV